MRSSTILLSKLSTRNDLLQRLHRGSDDRLVSGHGDAFADRRHRSGGSRTHRIDKEPTISRPTCHYHLMLCPTHLHTGMCRQLCAASLDACGFACEWALAVSCTAAAGPTMRGIPPGTVSNGVCYLLALTAEDRPRCRHRQSCPCLVGTTTRTLHAAATRGSDYAVEYSYGVTLRERSQAVLCALTRGYSVHWDTLSECSHGVL